LRFQVIIDDFRGTHHQRSFSKRARVKDWLNTEWSLSDVYDPNAHWILQAIRKEDKAGGQAFAVLQTTLFPDQLLIPRV
jgi:hypothetical protein